MRRSGFSEHSAGISIISSLSSARRGPLGGVWGVLVALVALSPASSCARAVSELLEATLTLTGMVIGDSVRIAGTQGLD